MEAIDIVLGAQFGDEGKGRIVNYLCASGKYKVCARFNGSDNAGHTAVLDSGKKIAFRQIPVGAVHGMRCVIAKGCMVDLEKLDVEIERVEQAIQIYQRSDDWSLYIDSRCHVKTQRHRDQDIREEQKRTNPIGTTLSGNGPAYSAKYARINQRVCDIDMSAFPSILRKAMVCDASLLDYNYCLIEGAHGIMLDIDNGTYPFVTSSGCTSGAACHSLGIAPHRIGRVIGVIKPYITRVGAGAFPTEVLNTELASRIREAGSEYGTNTKRPRRVAWLDIPALIYTIRVGGITELALAKLDILDKLNLDKVKVCIEYEGIAGGYVPPRDMDYQQVTPIYEDIKWDKCGENRLMNLIEEHTETPITVISRGIGEEGIKTR